MISYSCSLVQFSPAAGRAGRCRQMSLCVGSTRRVPATLGLPRTGVSVLSPSTLLRLPAALYGAGPALSAVPVFGSSTKARIRLRLHFVGFNFKKKQFRNFLGGPVAKILCSQRREPRRSGNYIPHAATKAQHSQINKMSLKIKFTKNEKEIRETESSRLIRTSGLCFPGGSEVKNPPADAGDAGASGSIPGWGRSPREGNGSPLHYSCLEKPHAQGSQQAAVHGIVKSGDTTDQTQRTSTHRLAL